MDRFWKFLRDWILPIAIAAGAGAYMIYAAVPAWHGAGQTLYHAVTVLQPTFIFCMLFLSFCQISPREMLPRRWHLPLLAIQAGTFILLSLVMMLFDLGHWGVLIEAAMLCMICPTATAAAVVTGKLGGDMPGIVTYLILINIVVAIVVPLFVPLVRPGNDVTFIVAFSLIMAKVFPLLIFPCLLAWVVRFTMPKLHSRLIRYKDLPFYIWVPSLALAILMTVRAIYHSDVPAVYQVGIAVVSLVCCLAQFGLGWKIGARFDHQVTAGQALGQKNTVFAIWMGYMFMEPVTAIAGGFYSIWHNVINSMQLYRHSKNQ